MEPNSEGKSGLEFYSEINGGNIPKEFVPSIEKGFKEAIGAGPLAGYELQGMKITVLDGSFHPVDSDQLSFEMAPNSVTRKLLPKRSLYFSNR